MSDKPVWMETWREDKGNVWHDDGADGWWEFLEQPDDDTQAEPHDTRAKLAAAAPALVRALLAVEWRGQPFRSEFSGGPDADGNNAYHGVARVDRCPQCTGNRWKHGPDCPLDAALTAAGFDTAEKRDAARKMMAEAKR